MDNNTDTKMDALLERIQALFDKAASTDFDEERDAYTKKAQGLLTKYAIDAAMLSSREVKADEIIHQRVWVAAPFANARVSLLSAIADANNLKLVRTQGLCNAYFGMDKSDYYADMRLTPTVTEKDQFGRGPKGVIATLTGYKSDVEATIALYTSLDLQMAAAKAKAEKPAWENAKAFANSFIYGFANGIGARLREANREAQAEAIKVYGDELLPALRNRAAAVQDVYEKHYRGTLRAGRFHGSTGGGGSAGRSAASRASVGSRSISSGTYALGRG